MAVKAPLVDIRTPAQIAEQTRELLCHYLSGPPYNWKSDDDGGDAGKALTSIFAHYCGLVIDRINRAPEKNFLAFLDLLGNSLTPPTPAEVPLTFFLDVAATEGVTVPAATRVQADPGEGASEPILFETVRDLWLTTFELKSFAKEPQGGSQLTDDLSALIKTLQSKAVEADEQVFSQNETYFFGLDLAPGRVVPKNGPVSLFFFIDNPEYDPTAARGLSDALLHWEYSDGAVWRPLVVEDGTQALTHSGSVEFLAPMDFSRTKKNLKQGSQPGLEMSLFWIRASLKSHDNPVDNAAYRPAPHVNGVALNTVLAQQAVSLRNEILGSSNGNPDQTFTTFRKPILPGQMLEVMERGLIATGKPGTEPLGWVPWQEVPDFHGSTPRDRHYVVNRQTGQIRFGNGRSGMIPPLGTRNVRIAYYRTGGGVTGNVPTGTLKTLLAGSRHIEKITNFAPAAGGADSETLDSLQDRAPKTLRHRGYAVAAEDYENLAVLASTEVARARCVSLIELAVQPSKVITTIEDYAIGAGKVSVIIVPYSRAPKPLPSQALMRHVESFLRERSIATTTLSVVGPLYLRVVIEVNLKLQSQRFYQRVDRELQERFTTYLHPLTGRNGKGWPFGRKPRDSDIYRLIGTVDGIDYATSLKITLHADERPLDCDSDIVDCIEKTGRFLIYSGQHLVTPA